jgi:hypothetical protein
MKVRSYAVIALTSAGLIALELIWTRLFSAEFFYSFAFLILSLAIMGLGLGALTLRFFPGLGRPGLRWGLLTLTGLAAVAGPPLVFRLHLDMSILFSDWAMRGKLVAAIAILGSAYFLGGIILAGYFKEQSRDIPRLYMADLLGAGTGVVLAILAMNELGTPAAALFTALPVLLAAILANPRWLQFVPVLILVGIVQSAPRLEPLLEADREERAPVIYKHWDAMAKLKIYDFGGHYRGINIDNVANTPVVPFDGNFEDDDGEDSGWDIDVGYLVGLFDECRFLSLGAGGGMDVLQALDHGAAEIHAVEVNPHINHMMLEGDPDGYITTDSTVVDSAGRIITCAEYSGHIYRDPRVRVVSEDARTYVRRHPDQFDVIFSLSSNTWAALASGSFALAENYLFTVEAFQDYWNALSEDGFLSMEHQAYMPRLVGEVQQALTELGVENPEEHFAVYNLPRMRRNLLLVSKRPLDDELRHRAYGPLTPERAGHIHLYYPAPDSVAGNLINQIVQNGWEAMSDSARVDLSPSTDDRPFVAQMGLWRNFDRESLGRINPWSEFFTGFPLSKLIVVTILAVVAVLLVPLNLLPYLGRGPKLGAGAWIYFFLIGMGFMAVEVLMIQRYTLLIGASVYSIATVLLVLLAASGVGSLFSDRFPARVAFAGIVLWLLLEVFLLGRIASGLAGLPLAGRIAATALLLAPLGFFMGMPFPKGVLKAGELADWGFAVNGAASVLGATGILLVAFTWGISTGLLVGAGLYLLAGLLLIPGSGEPVSTGTSRIK